jgi:hypothetical protein
MAPITPLPVALAGLAVGLARKETRYPPRGGIRPVIMDPPPAARPVATAVQLGLAAHNSPAHAKLRSTQVRARTAVDGNSVIARTDGAVPERELTTTRVMPTHLRSLVLPTVAVTLGFCAPGAAAADQTIAATPKPTGVAAGQGLVAYSAYDPAIRAYRLMIARRGTVEHASVRPSPTPFDVDVGPTQSGRAYLVYSRCESRDAPVPKGCDIYAYDPDSHRENRYGASSPSESDVHPTYWRGRVAFVRYYGSGEDPRPIVYTRRARSSRPSRRLPGLPARRCRGADGCGRVTGTIDELELYGDHLAETAFDITDIKFEPNQTEVRLVNVDSGRSEQVARRGSGESGQHFLGLSFRAGRLYAYLGCGGDTDGYQRGVGGAYRYRYSTGDWSHAASSKRLSAFAVSNLGTIDVAINAAGECGPIENAAPAPCQLVLREPPPSYRVLSRPPR